MKSVALIRSSKNVSLALCIAATLISCTKKEEKTVAPAIPAETSTAPAAAPAPAAPAATTPPAFDATKYLADTDAALKAKEYDKAVQALFTMQRQQLTDQQSQAARNRMIQIQSSLGAALQSGDPRAKAAVEMIRRSTMQ